MSADKKIITRRGIYRIAVRKEDNTMADIASVRYCSVRESLTQSCKEVAQIRSGKLPRRTWADLLLDVQKMKAEVAKDDVRDNPDPEI